MARRFLSGMLVCNHWSLSLLHTVLDPWQSPGEALLSQEAALNAREARISQRRPDLLPFIP